MVGGWVGRWWLQCIPSIAPQTCADGWAVCVRCVCCVRRFLCLDMFDSDIVSKDNFLGRCVISLAHVSASPIGEWHDLGKRGPKSRACGRVLLVMSTDAPLDDHLWAALDRARDAM